MNDRVAVVTGTRKGLGRKLAEHLLGQGYRVVGCSRKPNENDMPSGYSHHCVDVTDEKQVTTLFRSVRKEYGRLDALINNAGIASMNHALLTPSSTVSRILETNVTSVFRCSREAAKLMKGHSYGRIVNFTTVATPLKLEGEAAYAASKAAVISLTEIFARELATYGITVNAVGPCPIRTDLIRNVPEEKLADLVARQAIKRFGEPDDVANVVDFFLSPASTMITGQTIFLGGV